MRQSEATATYDNAGKSQARDIVVSVVAERRPESVLDLYGGGASARAIAHAVPGVALVSCETDPELWPAMRLDGQTHGFVGHCGDFRSAKGLYDFIWLDACWQWSDKARRDAIAASRMLSRDGAMAITLLAARERTETAIDRLFIIPRAIEEVTGLAVRLLYSYQTNSPMWLVVLAPGHSDWGLTPYRLSPFISDRIGAVGDEAPFDAVRASMTERGYWMYEPWEDWVTLGSRTE